MRILVVHLLRLGDVLMAGPAIAGLKRKHPSSEIHMLVNEGLPDLSRLMPDVDVWHHFPRQHLQSLARERNKRLLEPVETILRFTDQLNALRFHMAFNLTQNRLSARLFSLIDCEDKSGMLIDEQDRVSFGSAWLRHLNSDVTVDRKRNFHFTDIFFGVFGDEESSRSFRFSTSLNSDHEAETLLQNARRKVVAIQPLTSDSKKNWSMTSWKQLLGELSSKLNDCTILILGAEFERSTLEKLHRNCADPSADIRVAVVDLSGALSLLNRSDILVTGDTAIKHLAVGSSCKIVELSLGSSEPLRTGAYKDGSLILNSTAHCRPCPHSSSCPQERHICGEDISVDVVLNAVQCQMSGEKASSTATVECLRVHHKPGLPWILKKEEESNAALVDDLIEKVSWRLHLGDIGERVPPVASQGRHILHLLRGCERMREELHRLEKIEQSLRDQHQSLSFLRDQVPKIAAFAGGSELRWAHFLRDLRRSGVDLVNGNSSPVDFLAWRRVQQEIESASVVCENRIKLIRTMRNQEIGQETGEIR